MKEIALNSPLKRLSSDALTMQIGCAELPLASFLVVLSFYGEGLGGCGFAVVLSTITLQAPLDRAHGELPSCMCTFECPFYSCPKMITINLFKAESTSVV